MNKPSEPTLPQPPDSEVNPVFQTMAKLLADSPPSAVGLTRDELIAHLNPNGHAVAAIQWAIYRALERKWLTQTVGQRQTRSESAHTGRTEAKLRNVEVNLLVPTQEFWNAWKTGNLNGSWAELDRHSHDKVAPNEITGEKATEIEPSELPPPACVVWPIHGIWTDAPWQKELAELATKRGWFCPLKRWHFGRFSPIAFLIPRAREAKLQWFREQCDAQMNDKRQKLEDGRFPSVVAHSFGTYILGCSLIRFDFIRFEKVILCGSILPVDFPWDKLIARGQVQAVRNEYGVRDPWVALVRWFVRGTGPSGATGFACMHDRLEQEKFAYAHSEYFGADHMEDRWFPFLEERVQTIPRSKSELIQLAPAPWPKGFYFLLLPLIVLILLLSSWGLICAYRCFWTVGDGQASSVSAQTYTSTSYAEAIAMAEEATAANDWSDPKFKVLNKSVSWDTFIFSSEGSGYVIQPREQTPGDGRWNAAVALSARSEHPPYGLGRAVTVAGRISKFDKEGIIIVGATVRTRHTAEGGAE